MVMQKRQPREKVYRKAENSQLHLITLAIVLTTVITMCLSRGAIELESYANRNYDQQPNYGTELTCLLTPINCKYEHGFMCDAYILEIIHRHVVYYGVRLDFYLSHPLFLIALWFHWKDTFGKRMLYAAFFLAIVKFMAITSVFVCIMMDEGSCMREIFEKAQFGSYESKILYSYAMVVLSSLVNTVLLFALTMAYFHPKPSASKYQVGPTQTSGNMWSFNHKKVLDNVKQVIANSRNVKGASMIKAYSISDIEEFSTKSNPV